MASNLFLTLWICLFIIVPVVQSICAPYTHNITGTPHRCDSAIEDETIVYLTQDKTQEEIQTVIEKEFKFLDVLDFVGGSSCKQSIILFVCQSAFKTCNDSYPDGFASPCREKCEEIGALCTPFLALADVDLPDCDELSQQCNNTSSNSTLQASELVCYPPYLFPDPKSTKQSYNEGPCYSCPAAAFSNSSQRILDIFTAIVSGIGALLALAAFFMFIGSSRFRTFQTQFFPIISADAFAMGICVLVCTISPNAFVCESKARLAHVWHVPCTIQGMFLIFAANQLLVTWGLMATNLAYITFRGTKLVSGKFPLHYRVIVYCVLWGIPSAITFICLVSGLIEAIPGLPFCFITIGHRWAQWLFYFGFPMIPSTFIGVGSLLYLLYHFYTQPQVAASSKSKSQTRNLVIAHLVCYLGAILYTLGYRLYSESLTNVVATNFRKCANENLGNIDKCFENDIVSLPATLIFVFSIGGVGILLFVTFLFGRSFRVLIASYFGPFWKQTFGQFSSSDTPSTNSEGLSSIATKRASTIQTRGSTA